MMWWMISNRLGRVRNCCGARGAIALVSKTIALVPGEPPMLTSSMVAAGLEAMRRSGGLFGIGGRWDGTNEAGRAGVTAGMI